MKKIYEVNMTVFVMAEDEQSAYAEATGCEVEIPFDDCEIIEAESVPKKWLNATLYGSDDDKPLSETLKLIEKLHKTICACEIEC